MGKFTRRTLSIVLSLVLAAGLCTGFTAPALAAPAGGVATSVGVATTPGSDFEYSIDQGGVYITGYTGSSTDVVVPAQIDGVGVTGISFDSLRLTSLKVDQCNTLMSLSLHDSHLATLDVSYNTALESMYFDNGGLNSLDISENPALAGLTLFYSQIAYLTVSDNQALTDLFCQYNQLTSLEVINNTALTALYCYNDQLTYLDVSKNTTLTDLDCSENQLTSLDVSNDTALTTLYCFDNQLTSLDVSRNTALADLYCSRNQLTSIDVSDNTALTQLICSGNQLTSLDVSKNTALTSLDCSDSQLASIDVSDNTALAQLICFGNQLKSLDVSKNTTLIDLDCSDNQLTTLDVSKNPALWRLNCYNNQLTALDVSKNTALSTLYCYGNQITDTSALEAWLAYGGRYGQVLPQNVCSATNVSSKSPSTTITIARNSKTYNLLKDRVSFEEDSTDTGSFTASIDWGSHTPGKVYVMQNVNKMIYLPNINGQYIASGIAVGKSLSPGQSTYLVAYDSSNNVVCSKILNLYVTEKQASGNLLSTFRLFDLFDYNIDNGKPVFGGISGSLDFGPLTGSVEITDSTFKVAFGTNYDCKDGYDAATHKFTADGFSSFKDTFNKAKDDAKKGLKAKDLAKAFGSPAAFNTTKILPAANFDVSAMGYLEGYIDKDGNWIVSDGGLIVDGSAGYTVYGQAVLGPVPVCFEFSGKLGVEASLGAKSITGGSSAPIAFAGTLTPSVSAEVYGGVGIACVCSVGASGKATLSFQVALDRNYQKLDLTGRISLQAKAFGFLLGELKIAQGTWVIYETGRSGVNTLGMGQPQVLFPPLNNNAVPDWEPRADGPGAWLGGAGGQGVKALGQTDGATLLASNIYAGAAPKLAKMGGKTILYWIEDAPGRSDANKSMLVYSVSNGTTWSAPQAVADDGTADFTPSVCDGYIAWDNSNKVFDDTTTTIGGVLSAGEVDVAKWNGSGFDAPVAITDNDIMDTYPVLAQSGSDLSVVWLENSANDLYGTSGTNSIMRSDLGGTSWSAPSAVYQTTKPIVAMDACLDGGDLDVAFIPDEDSDLNTVDNRDVWLYSNGAARNITSNAGLGSNPVFKDINGVPTLFYYEDGNICYRALDSGQVQAVFNDGAQVQGDSFDVIPGQNGDMTIAYPVFSDGGAEVWAVMYKDGEWGLPVQLTKTGQDVKTVSGEQDSDGSYLFAVNLAQKVADGDSYTDGQSDLCLIRPDNGCDLMLSGPSYGYSSLARGDSLPIDMTVSNQGTQGVSGYTVTIKNQDGTVNSTQAFDQAMAPGASSDITVDYLAPVDLTQQTVSLEVSQSEAPDTDASNNVATLTVGGKDLTVRDAAMSGIYPDQQVTATVANDGTVDVGNIEVQLRAGSKDGNVLASQDIATLGVGEGQDVSFDIAPSDVGVDVQTYFVTVTPQSDELYPDNNSAPAWNLVPQGQFNFAVTDATYDAASGAVSVAAVASQNGLADTTQLVTYQVKDAGGNVIGSFDQTVAFDSSDVMAITAVVPVSQDPSTGYTVDLMFADASSAPGASSAKDVTAVTGPTGADISGTYITATVANSVASQVVALSVSDKASWKLFSDAACTTEIADKDLALDVGVNSAFIQVTAEDGSQRVYTLAITRQSDNPVVIPVTGVSLDQTTMQLAVGAIGGLAATVSPDDATDKVVTWSSDDEAVATVDAATGAVLGVSPGDTVITATTADGSKAASCTVTVVAATGTPVAPAITTSVLPRATVGAAYSAALAATGDAPITWSLEAGSALPGGLELSAGGVISGMPTAAGSFSFTIVATNAGGSGVQQLSIDVASSTVPVTGVALNATTKALTVGNGFTLAATVSPSDATNKSVAWSSSDPLVASVNPATGAVMAVSPGSAVITATTVDGGKTAQCAVTVTAAIVPVTGVALNAVTKELAIGDSFTLTATLSPVNATYNSVSWSSSNPLVASVNAVSGTVLAVSPGSAVITATTTQGGMTAQCTVTVAAAPEPPLAPAITTSTLSGATVGAYFSQALAATGDAPITWSLEAGSALPAGLGLSAGGIVSGTPTVAGTFGFTVVATNAGGSATQALSIVVAQGTVAVKGVSLDAATKSVIVGDNFTIKATVSPANATNKSVTWASSNTAVATVGATTGTVKAVAPGKAVITASAGGGTVKATCTVTVAAKPVTATPLITAQPVAASYYQKQAAKALKVSASTGDKGVLSYQWYSNTANSTTGAKAIAGAKSVSYTPPTTKAGALYYFCKVTNTKAGSSPGTKAVNSARALIRVAPDFNGQVVMLVPDAKTGLRVDIPGQSKAAGVQAGLWASNNGPNQRFVLTRDASGLYRIKDVNSGLYLSVKGGAAKSGAAIVLGKSSTSKAQRFKIDYQSSGKYTLSSALDGAYVIGIKGSSTKSGASLVLQKQSAAATSQVFRLSAVKPLVASGTVVTVKNVATGRYIDISGASLSNKAQLITYSATGGANQKYRLTYDKATGYYKVIPLHSLKPLTVNAGQTFLNGATLYQYSGASGLNQEWGLKQDSSGHYIIYQPGSGQVLSAAGGSKVLCTPVILWPANGRPDQAWVLKKQ